MPKFIYLFTIFLFSFSTFIFAQNRTDKAKAIALFKATDSLFVRLLNFRVTNRDSALIINKELIAKYEEVYNTDTSNSYVGFYLMNCYIIEKNFREVINWAKNQIMHEKNLYEKVEYNYTIACAFINFGEFDSSKKYINAIIQIGEKVHSAKDSMIFYKIESSISGIKEMADLIYIRPDSSLAKQLQLKGDRPCKYSIQILNYIQPYAKIYFDKPKFLKANSEIETKQKNCR